MATHEDWQRELTERANETGRVYWEKIALSICPVCGEDFVSRRQEHFYVFAVPCGHCIYQVKRG